MPTAGNNGMHQNHTLSLHGLPEKRARILPPTSERIMIYVKQDSELAFTALHLKPPTIQGLILALESKYKINGRSIRHLHRVNRLGHKVKIGNLLKFTQSYSNLLKFTPFTQLTVAYYISAQPIVLDRYVRCMSE